MSYALTGFGGIGPGDLPAGTNDCASTPVLTYAGDSFYTADAAHVSLVGCCQSGDPACSFCPSKYYYVDKLDLCFPIQTLSVAPEQGYDPVPQRNCATQKGTWNDTTSTCTPSVVVPDPCIAAGGALDASGKCVMPGGTPVQTDPCTLAGGTLDAEGKCVMPSTPPPTTAPVAQGMGTGTILLLGAAAFAGVYFLRSK